MVHGDIKWWQVNNMPIENLIKNGSFENGFADWKTFTSVESSVTLSTTNPYEGLYSVEVTGIFREYWGEHSASILQWIPRSAFPGPGIYTLTLGNRYIGTHPIVVFHYSVAGLSPPSPSLSDQKVVFAPAENTWRQDTMTIEIAQDEWEHWGEYPDLAMYIQFSLDPIQTAPPDTTLTFFIDEILLEIYTPLPPAVPWLLGIMPWLLGIIVISGIAYFLTQKKR